MLQHLFVRSQSPVNLSLRPVSQLTLPLVKSVSESVSLSFSQQVSRGGGRGKAVSNTYISQVTYFTPSAAKVFPSEGFGSLTSLLTLQYLCSGCLPFSFLSFLLVFRPLLSPYGLIIYFPSSQRVFFFFSLFFSLHFLFINSFLPPIVSLCGIFYFVFSSPFHISLFFFISHPFYPFHLISPLDISNVTITL